MALSSKQREYLNNCNHRWNIKVGATGSGKSWLDYAVVIPKRLLALRGQGPAVLLGNTQGTLSRNMVGTISSDNTARLFGRRVHILGADNRKHVARLQGMTIEYAYGDEMTTWHEEVFQMLKSRLRCEHSYFDGTANPAHPQHFLKQFLASGVDVYAQTSTIDDNPFLPSEFVENLKKEYAGTVYYNRFILGQWAAAEGAIYRHVADRPQDFILHEAPPVLFATIGVDFGGNGSATAFNCTGFAQGLREIVTLREYYRKGILSPAELEQDFVDFVRGCSARWRVADSYCDSAEQTLIQGLRTACAREHVGINIHNARKGAINDRIRFFCRMQAAGRHKIMRDCPRTLEAFRSAVWDSRYVTRDVRLDDGTYNVDSLDAQEYAVEPYMRQMMDII